MQRSDSPNLETPATSKPGSGNKRKRLVLSCLECKRRKLKCDRQLPVCSRCSEIGHPEQCKYDERSIYAKENNTFVFEDPRDPLPTPPNARVSIVTSPPEATRILQLERHIADLEARLARATNATSALPQVTNRESALHATSSVNSTADYPTNEALMWIRGGGFKTRCRGPSSPVSILTHVRTSCPDCR